MVAVICVPVPFTTRLLAVTPVPLKVTAVAPAKLVPLMITPVKVAPCTPELGLRAVNVGNVPPPPVVVKVISAPVTV